MRRSPVFDLDPAAEGTLTSQLAENLRSAVFNGIFRAGDVLPGVRKMADLCGTSEGAYILHLSDRSVGHYYDRYHRLHIRPVQGFTK